VVPRPRIHARVSGPYFDYDSVQTLSSFGLHKYDRPEDAVRRTSRGPMRSRCTRNADLRPDAAYDSLVWGGVQQIYSRAWRRADRTAGALFFRRMTRKTTEQAMKKVGPLPGQHSTFDSKWLPWEEDVSNP
jgi:hypothetical protein